MSITEQRPAEPIPRRFQDPHHITAKKRRPEFYMTVALWRSLGEPSHLAILSVTNASVYLAPATEGIKIDRRWQFNSRHLWRILRRTTGGERYAATVMPESKVLRIKRTPMEERPDDHH
jgi:hypothetical protein